MFTNNIFLVKNKPEETMREGKTSKNCNTAFTHAWSPEDLRFLREMEDFEELV